MHSPSTRIGTPPSIAVQRSGPAASARPSACVTSRSCPTAPLAVVARLLEAAHTALVVQECTVWKRPPSMRSSTIDMAAGVDDAARDRDLGLAGLLDGDRHHLARAVVGQALGVGDVAHDRINCF